LGGKKVHAVELSQSAVNGHCSGLLCRMSRLNSSSWAVYKAEN